MKITVMILLNYYENGYNVFYCKRIINIDCKNKENLEEKIYKEYFESLKNDCINEFLDYGYSDDYICDIDYIILEIKE